MITSPNQMEIFVNGERFEVQSGSSVSELLAQLKIIPDRVAVELNKILVRKRDWEVTAILPGSHLEVVEFVGGG